MKEIFITTTTFKGGTPVFNKAGLDFSQKRFVDKMAKLINKDKKPKNVAMVYWRNEEDFCGMGMHVEDPNEGIQALKQTYAESTGSTYPQVGFRYDRDWFVEHGGEMAAKSFDMLAEGGVWPWANARAVFQKQGDVCVVTQVLEA